MMNVNDLTSPPQTNHPTLYFYPQTFRVIRYISISVTMIIIYILGLFPLAYKSCRSQCITYTCVVLCI